MFSAMSYVDISEKVATAKIWAVGQSTVKVDEIRRNTKVTCQGQVKSNGLI